MSKFKFQNQVDTIIKWYNQCKSYTEIARLLNSENINNDAANIRRLVRKQLGDVHGHHKNSKGSLVYDYSLYIQFRGTKAFFQGVCSHLGITESHIHQNDSIPCLCFANKKNTYRLFQCYKGLPFYYKRKYDVFLKRINHPSYDKYKQVQTISSPTE